MSAAYSVLPEEKKQFPVYLDIEVGGKSKEELLAELKACGCYLSSDAEDIISRMTWELGEKRRIKFGRATIGGLGFTKGPTHQDILERIGALGHAMCEPADGIAIRIADKDQGHRDSYMLAMKAFHDLAEGDSFIFQCVRNRDGLKFLGTTWKDMGFGWFLDGVVVFRLGE